MGRGKALRSKVKEKKALTKAELQAKKEWEQRSSNVPYMMQKQLLKFADNITFDDFLAIGVGMWGWKHLNNPTAFLSGAIGYKLARTEGGTPPVSQVAGLAILAGMGLIGLAPGIAEALSIIASGGSITHSDVQDIETLNQLGAPPKELTPEEEEDTTIQPFSPETGCSHLGEDWVPWLTLDGWVCKYRGSTNGQSSVG